MRLSNDIKLETAEKGYLLSNMMVVVMVMAIELKV